MPPLSLVHAYSDQEVETRFYRRGFLAVVHSNSGEPIEEKLHNRPNNAHLSIDTTLTSSRHARIPTGSHSPPILHTTFSRYPRKSPRINYIDQYLLGSVESTCPTTTILMDTSHNSMPWESIDCSYPALGSCKTGSSHSSCPSLPYSLMSVSENGRNGRDEWDEKDRWNAK